MITNAGRELRLHLPFSFQRVLNPGLFAGLVKLDKQCLATEARLWTKKRSSYFVAVDVSHKRAVMVGHFLGLRVSGNLI